MSVLAELENSYEFQYYQVKCLNDIKFSIYDFKERPLINVSKIKLESQEEYKKENIPNFIQKKKKKKMRIY